MKTFLSSLLLFFSLIPSLFATTPTIPTKDMDKLLSAIATVESTNNPKAINRKELAYGLYQIRPIAVAEYTRLTKKTFSHNDAFNPTLATNFTRDLLNSYASYIHKTKGSVSLKDLARCWNGGILAFNPQSKEKEAALSTYWTKIQRHL